MAKSNIRTGQAPEKADPVNSEQAEAAALEAKEDVPAGPSTGELEERAAEAENRAEAAERQVLDMRQEIDLLKDQIAQLARSQATVQSVRVMSDRLDDYGQQAGEPVFDETMPYGLVVGDERVAYVQDGHQFGRDRRFLRTETHRGSPRAFNPRMVGYTKPRPGASAIDALEGIRDR